jgi:large subunit ribosomal protein L24
VKIRKDDQVKVLQGRDKGRVGKVERVLRREKEVVVTGMNVVKKNVKARQGQKGGIIDIIKPLGVSKVALVCPKCGKPTRVGWQWGDGVKKRQCRKCEELI